MLEFNIFQLDFISGSEYFFKFRVLGILSNTLCKEGIRKLTEHSKSLKINISINLYQIKDCRTHTDSYISFNSLKDLTWLNQNFLFNIKRSIQQK